MKRTLLILLSFLLTKTVLADHITGGEMYYTYLGGDGTNHRYQVTLKLFRNCGTVGAALDAEAAIGIFDKSSNQLVGGVARLVPLGSRQFLNLTTPGPCISNAPTVCYEVGYYEFTVSLPSTVAGYTISYQRCCRIQGISNLASSNNTGATYSADIPGTVIRADAPQNSSAKFTGTDTVIVCGGYPFTYSFGATDPDTRDQLRYSFCDAWIGGSGGNQGVAAPNPPANPPYIPVAYRTPYSGTSPLGPNVTINPTTGLISGVSPPEGIYVVTVCVSEIRDGVVIATQRKDLQIKAGGCDLSKPILEDNMITCDGLSYSFIQQNNPKINTYHWEFGDPASGINNVSTEQSPTHIFSAPGQYTVKVVANRGQECSDSSTGIVKVYPGFFPAFNTTGVCITNPVLFADATTTNFGVVDSWTWDFGDEASVMDVSTQRTDSWKYSTPGTKTVKLTVTSSMGCSKTILKQLPIIEKPPITLAFKDTLICVPDAVQLQASGSGIFSWTPTTNMINAGTGTPTVNPVSTTKYYVQLNEQGCINTDSVLINVVTFVTLVPMADTTICLTDTVQLRVHSDGLRYEWTPAASLNNASIKNPLAVPTGTTAYQVTARIGSCNATRSINVSTVPYPIANAGLDTVICYNSPAYLNGSHDGIAFTWSPVNSLINATTLTPIAYPARTQQYILSAYDNDGCPKPGRDTVLVTVMDRIFPYAGNDTMVVVGQPLQLNAEGGVSYLWTPPNYLNNNAIKNPIGVYGSEIDSIRYTVAVFNEIGCSDTARVKVTVFKTNPYVFVPDAFTPNDDGLNDVIRPIAVGIKQINYFRIFNRWGQLLFSTTTNGHGWDGTVGGEKQGSNVFVWMVDAVDYLGQPLTLKGTVTLIR